MNSPFLSVCIPTYEMSGFGAQFLRESFDKLVLQTFKDFEVVISDNSQTDVIKNVCNEYKEKLVIAYFVNMDSLKEMAPNTNNTILHARGKIIKILMQDDFLYDETSLEKIVSHFDLERDHWLVTGSEHSKDGHTFFRPFYPTYSHDMHLGHNTIGSPSVITIKNEHPFLFARDLKFAVDCDYYKRYYDAFGEPKILNEINVVNRIGEHQASSYLSDILKENEYDFMLKKYNVKNRVWLLYKRRAIRYLVYIKRYLKKPFLQ